MKQNIEGNAEYNRNQATRPKEAERQTHQPGREEQQVHRSGSQSWQERQMQARQEAQRERRQLIRKRRAMLRTFIHVEILVVVGMVCFIIGRKTGVSWAEKEFMAAVQSSASNQIYGAEQENSGNISYVTESGNEKDGSPEADASGSLTGQTTISGTVGQSGIAETDDKNTVSSGSLTADQRQLEILWEAHPELLLVNKDYKLPDDYKVTLKTLPDGTNKGAKEVYEPLCAMLKAGRKEGLNFEICSSYRSVERQQELLDEDINALMRKGYSYEEAYEEVTKGTMPPGYSEHATGMAFDIVALSYQMLDKKQQNTPESIWLREHCAEYGFILRYPSDKEDVTGISYESWHFRYVGEEAAQYIMENGITLEEYLQEYLDGTLDIDI